MRLARKLTFGETVPGQRFRSFLAAIGAIKLLRPALRNVLNKMAAVPSIGNGCEWPENHETSTLHLLLRTPALNGLDLAVAATVVAFPEVAPAAILYGAARSG